jgi:hypothetical protein
MFVHWREREHEEVDHAIFDDDDAKEALSNNVACIIFSKLVECELKRDY